MAVQRISIEVRQQHSGGDLTIEETWTTDGVLVRTWVRRVRVTGGGTLNKALTDRLIDTAIGQCRAWEQAETLW